MTHDVLIHIHDPDPPKWTDERTKELKALWGQGYTASQIGKELGIKRNAVLGKIWRLRQSETGTDIPSRDPSKSSLHWAKYKAQVNARRVQRRRNLTPEQREAKRQYERNYWFKAKKFKQREKRRGEVAKLFLRSGCSKTSREYRKHLPHIPEMSKAQLRAMLTEAVRNTI